MSDKPLVSCIIIFFNAERFFEEAIESVFAQTYENWELLLVDDGSTDTSTAIARRYVEKYPDRARYLEHEGHHNRGMSATRNLGIDNARGEYIAFLDADDVWLPEKLERQVAILESHPEASMVQGAYLCWYSWTGKAEDMPLDWVASGIAADIPIDTSIEPPRMLTSCILVAEEKTGTPCPSSILLRREAVMRIGGFEESFRGIYQMFEDRAFFTKLYLQDTVFVAGEYWDKYRIHPDSCCSVVEKAGKFEVARLFYLKWAERYFTERGIEDPRIWKRLRRLLWLEEHSFWNQLFKNTEKLSRKAKSLPRSIARKALPDSAYQWLKLKGKNTQKTSQL